MNSEWNVGKHLVWETEKPFHSRSRESPEFFFQGHSCVLELSVKHDNFCQTWKYVLRIKSETVGEYFRSCRVTVYLKGSCGSLLLSVFTKLSVPNLKLWDRRESKIEENIEDFHLHGILRFVLIFEDYVIADTLRLKDTKKEKPVQTPLYLDDHPWSHGLSEDLSKLLDGDSSPHDVKLKCGDDTFGAHKNILCARSQVFAKMLQSDMLECQTGLVEIRDMDAGILGHFLRYLNTGTLPELTTELARSLYEAADKYAVSELTRKCSSLLTEGLTSDNACHLLLFADAHSDSQFKESVISYIVNKKSLLQSDKWQVFCNEQPLLANEVLNRFCQMHLPKEINATTQSSPPN